MNHIESMKTKINEYIKNCEERIEFLRVILPTLQCWEGKAINKRLITQLEKDISSIYHVYLDVKDYSIHLRVYQHSFNDGVTFYLCDPRINTSKRFSMEYFKEQNAYMFNDNEEIIRYKEGLKRLELWNASINAIENLIKEQKTEMGNFGCQHTIDWKYLTY